MELSIARSNRSVQIATHRVLVDIRGLFGKLIRQQINQVFHKVALRHEQVLSNVGAVLFKLVLGEEDMQQLLVGFFVRGLHPDLELGYVQVVLLSLERCLEAHIQNPVMLVAASTNEVDGLAGLKDLVREVVCEERRYHYIVELVLFGPELVVADIRVCLNEELLEWIVYFSCDHPDFDQG